jgi:hypothetical protein
MTSLKILARSKWPIEYVWKLSDKNEHKPVTLNKITKKVFVITWHWLNESYIESRRIKERVVCW